LLSHLKSMPKLPFISLMALCGFVACSALQKPAENIIAMRTDSDALLPLVQMVCSATDLNQADCNRLVELQGAFVDAWELAANQVELAAALEEAGADEAPRAVAEAILLSARAWRLWEAYRKTAVSITTPLSSPTMGAVDGGESEPAELEPEPEPSSTMPAASTSLPEMAPALASDGGA